MNKTGTSAQTTQRIATLFAQALAQHQAGRLGEAKALYEQVLSLDGSHANALNYLGTLHLQLGRHLEGIQLIEKSLAINPDQPMAHMSRGNALRELRRMDEALVSYDRAIALKPDFAEAYYNRGNTLNDLKLTEKALADYDRAIALKPNYALAYFNRGNVLRELKRLQDALASYDRAIAINPNFAEAYYNRGYVLNDLRRPDEALADCDLVVALMPNFSDAHYNRGNALRELRRSTEALASYDRAIALIPDHAKAFCNRGNALRDLGRLDEALTSYDRAIALKPDFADAHNNRGNVLQDLNRYPEAILSYEKAITIEPGLPYLLGSWLHSRMHCCDWNDLDAAFAEISRAVDHGRKATTPFFLLSVPSTPAQQQHCATIYVEDKYPASTSPLWKGERYAHERIRVGYFSSDFRNHAMAHLIAEMIERHDRSKFEIIAFSFAPPSDSPIRRRLEKAFDRFLDVSARTDREIAALARQMEIDITIDLNGFTANSRMGIFALRPAPIQANHLGYPGTLGAGYMDYIIADKTVIPPEHQPYYTEKVVFLPDTYWFNNSTKAISDAPLSRSELGLPDDVFVFCCFNNSYKITPDLFDIWMRLLRKVEKSVLWLLEGNARATANLRLEAGKRGISPERLVFAPRMELASHLARHRHADLFLDTFYYNAHTTAAEALWAGLPVLTCLGNSFAGRVAASLLNAVGLPELVTHSRAEYESLAYQLATQPEKLDGIRQQLARYRNTRPLFDTARFTKNIEKAYLKMHQRQQAGLSPDNIVVGA